MVWVLSGILLAACWGDEIPALNRVGIRQAETGELEILFAGCPGEGVTAVAVKLTDDNFEEVERVAWEIEVDDGFEVQGRFTVGRAPPGFSEVTSLVEPLRMDDHLLAVITSSEVGTIAVSFLVDDLRSDEVLVRPHGFRNVDVFEERAAESCS